MLKPNFRTVDLSRSHAKCWHSSKQYFAEPWQCPKLYSVHYLSPHSDCEVHKVAVTLILQARTPKAWLQPSDFLPQVLFPSSLPDTGWGENVGYARRELNCVRGQHRNRHTYDGTSNGNWYFSRYKVRVLFKKVIFIEVIVSVTSIEAKWGEDFWKHYIRNREGTPHKAAGWVGGRLYLLQGMTVLDKAIHICLPRFLASRAILHWIIFKYWMR